VRPARALPARMRALLCWTALAPTFVAALTRAEDSPLTLATKLTNPFSDVINLSINQNPDFDLGGDEGWRYTITVQPVIPFRLDDEWHLISRTVAPVIYQDSAGARDFGLGDIAQSLFLSPTHASEQGWFWGLGPILLLPTATVDPFGAKQWGLGPTLGLLTRAGPWTVGALTNHIFSLGGHEGKSDVNTTFLQPFVDYTTDSKTTFSINTESVYDWTNEQWTAPIHLVVRQLFELLGQKVSVALGGRYYVATSPGGARWGLRLGITFIFPQ
jgi:hypothetical protein